MMSDSNANHKDLTGQCLCGAVAVKATAATTHFGACHCSICRTWSGGPFLSLECDANVEFSGEESVNTFASSEWAERSFCKHCGTHLFYRLKGTQHYYLSLGLFADDNDMRFDHQIFIDNKPYYYEFKNKTHNMTGAEVFAMFGDASS